MQRLPEQRCENQRLVHVRRAIRDRIPNEQHAKSPRRLRHRKLGASHARMINIVVAEKPVHMLVRLGHVTVRFIQLIEHRRRKPEHQPQQHLGDDRQPASTASPIHTLRRRFFAGATVTTPVDSSAMFLLPFRSQFRELHVVHSHRATRFFDGAVIGEARGRHHRPHSHCGEPFPIPEQPPVNLARAT